MTNEPVFEPTDAPLPEQTAADISADALEALAKLRDQLKDAEDTPATRRIRREIDRLTDNLEVVRSEALELSMFLAKQPSPDDLRFPQRHLALVSSARVRLAKSKYQFPEPSAIVAALRALAPSPDVDELAHRILHALTKLSLVEHGMAVSSVLRRLVKLGYCTTLPPGTEAEVAASSQVEAARAALAAFLEEARRGSR